jgi:hypothetical protein
LIIRLIGGSARQILRRQQVLFHHGYLDRPTSQVTQLAHAFHFGNCPSFMASAAPVPGASRQD